MTIRDYLRRRQLLARWVGWGFLVLIPTGMWSLARPSVGPYGLYIVASAVVAVAFLWVVQQQLVRCPRCGGSLIRLYTQISFGDVRSCPHCHASFEEPYRA
jgi:hypothetical protein